MANNNNHDVDHVGNFIINIKVTYTLIFLIFLPFAITLISFWRPDYEDKIKSTVINFTSFTGVASLFILIREKKT